MEPTDLIQVPIEIIIDMLLSGDISPEELSDEQIMELPDYIKIRFNI